MSSERKYNLCFYWNITRGWEQRNACMWYIRALGKKLHQITRCRPSSFIKVIAGRIMHERYMKVKLLLNLGPFRSLTNELVILLHSLKMMGRLKADDYVTINLLFFLNLPHSLIILLFLSYKRVCTCWCVCAHCLHLTFFYWIAHHWTPALYKYNCEYAEACHVL